MHSIFQKLSILPNAFLLSWGWQRRILCLVCGAVSALALPPFSLYPVLFLTLPGFIWLLDGAIESAQSDHRKRAWTGFVLGWSFGFGYFLAGLWWIGSAFLVEADKYAWLMPLAVLAMPLGLAFFTGLGTALAAALWTDRSHRILLLAACLTLSDWLRGNVLTGFPWNSFGYAVSDNLVLSQVASVFGIYGLGFLVLCICAAPAILADARPLKQRLGAVAVAGALLVSIAGYGFVRLGSAANDVADLDVRIIQPSIDQKDKWQPELRDRIFQTYLDMSEAPLGGSARVGVPRLVVWPESAVPFLLTQEPGALLRIAGVLGENAELATGAIRVEAGEDGSHYYNSIFKVSSSGDITGLYDKVRLVPFGEFIPFKDVLKRIGVSNLAGPMEGFEAGYSRRSLKTAGSFSFLPMICYEIIFPVEVPERNKIPEFLLNVTNDAWFGRTPGPYQHFAQARMRTIETGIPLIRAANTGVSAIVDGYGRVIHKLSIFEKGVIDGNLPQRIDRTIYGSFGDIFVIIAMLSIVVFTVVSRDKPSSRVN